MKIFLAVFVVLQVGLLGLLFASAPPIAVADTEPMLYLYGRDDCGFCKEAFVYLEAENIDFTYRNIVTDETAKAEYDAIAEKHTVSKVTPIMVIGERVLVGFNGPRTTGLEIKSALDVAKNSDIRTIEDHLARAPIQTAIVGGGCSELSCDTGGGDGVMMFELPFIGVVNLQDFSLFTLSIVLGLIDGFNPCAMWVLITFITLLSQAGSKKKMMFLAGLFILAQGIMYNLILNIWYQTWDFVALDQIVTPLVGFLALGGGLFFLWRWHKNKKTELVCDITDIDTQMKTINRFKQVVNSPITLASVAAILVIAFSVNIIEFACSIGIPQAYTKILELNMLTFMERQWYILVFSLAYMFDDLIVFGLAIWGYSKLQAHGGKYAQWSLLVGGVLMLVLGIILVANPQLLVL